MTLAAQGSEILTNTVTSKAFADEIACMSACQLWLMSDIAHYKSRGSQKVQKG